MASLENHQHEVSIFVRVFDTSALIRAAREKFVSDRVGDAFKTPNPNVTIKRLREIKKEAKETIPDRHAALRWFLDPGESPPGVEILDSSCE